MGDSVNNLVEQRLLRRAAIDMLAAPLEGDAREAFVRSAEARLNRDLPPPFHHQLRASLKIV